MTLTTVTSRTAAAVVAAVAGVISYGHIRAVATTVGETSLAARLIPLGIDGLIVVGTMAMLEDKRGQRRPRPSARFALGFGIIATILFNIGSAEPTWTARAVAAVPALSFLLAVEVLSRSGSQLPADTGSPADVPAPAGRGDTTPDTSRVLSPAEQRGRPSAARTPQGRPSAADRVAAAVRTAPTASVTELARLAAVAPKTVRRHLNGTRPDEVTR